MLEQFKSIRLHLNNLYIYIIFIFLVKFYLFAKDSSTVIH